ncbi:MULTISPECIES: DUF1778 domain-containing protein [unclassified Achromobacter]|uniref:type II toxin-antitoxin system TacA family antitoxin n=1 Tax=unclassified Achromobacter TaxID=2626865 RepID=UPI0009E9C000|nr:MULTISPECIES: DUF1778 domain-containing protein [unclassified Achromobacter]
MAQTSRLEARIPTGLMEMVKRAAEMEGRSLTDLVITSLQSTVVKTLERAEVIRLAQVDQARFAAALIDPAPPTPALKRAALRHRQLVQSK